MDTQREEAAPTFLTWRRRLEQAKGNELQQEIERFLQILKAIGTPMIDDSAVHFIYYGPEAQRVVLTGEMNQWNPRGTPLNPLRQTGIFYRTLEFRGPARVEYKFIVDGEWMLDPFCPNTIDNGLGERNSYLVIGDFQDPPELKWVPTIPHGRVEEFVFESEVLHNRRRVYVYLPPDYEKDQNSCFPTLYVHDGGEYRTRAHLPTIVDNLIHSQEIPPLIAVMVDPVERIREYWANENYAHFVESELLPHIDSQYRTFAHREGRGVMGASMGGVIATYLALSRPHLFSKVGGQSSALFLMEEERLSTFAKELLAKFDVSQGPRIEPKPFSALVAELQTPIAFYFDVGKYEPQFVPAHRRLVPQLEAKGCPCFFQELAGGHNWTSWRVHLKDLLTFLWKENGGTVNGTAKTQEEELHAPVGESPALRQGIDRLFVRFFNGWEMLFPNEPGLGQWSPTVESAVAGERLVFTVALPDVDPKDVGILVVGNQLVIAGERKTDGERSEKSPFSVGRSDERFARILPLPDGVNPEHIRASYRDGVLEISLPLPRGITARRIPIEIK